MDSLTGRTRRSTSRLARLLAALAILSAFSLALVNPAPTVDAQKGDGDKKHRKTVSLGPVAPPSSPAQRQFEPKKAKPVTRTLAATRAATANDTIDLKVLLISADGNEASFPAIKAFLAQIGIPYTTFIAYDRQTGVRTPLAASFLGDGVSRAYFQAVILSTGNLSYFNPVTQSWQSAFDQTDWNTLWNYEVRFGIRQVTAETYPGWPEADNFGLSYPPITRDTTTSPLPATLTTAGRQVFPYLQATAPLTITNAYAYLSTVANTSIVTPLVTTAPDPQNNNAQYALASIVRHVDGRENMTVTVAHNPFLMHSILLSYGMINWVTRGFFIGERHVNINYQPDDILIDNDIWDPQALSDATGLTYRMTGADLTATLNWQNSVRAKATSSTFRIEWPFNCEGATGIYSPDTLTPAVRSLQAQFNWISHTYTHLNLDSPVTAAQVQADLTNNRVCATRTLGLRAANFQSDAMVQPDISGLFNPQAITGAYNFGIRYWISDTSRPGWDNPTPNAGFYRGVALTNSQTPINPAPSLLIIPRKPTNLFYNLTTPAEWVSEYNCYYGPTGTCAGGAFRFWDHNLNYAEILDKESDWLLRYLLTWNLDPVMFHQPNMRAYDGVHSLFSDLVDATLHKYNQYSNLPIRNLTQRLVGQHMAARMAFNQANVRATWDRNRTITLTATQAASVPLTGIASGATQERYGNQPISTINVGANQTVTITLATAPPSP